MKSGTNDEGYEELAAFVEKLRSVDITTLEPALRALTEATKETATLLRKCYETLYSESDGTQSDK